MEGQDGEAADKIQHVDDEFTPFAQPNWWTTNTTPTFSLAFEANLHSGKLIMSTSYLPSFSYFGSSKSSSVTLLYFASFLPVVLLIIIC